MYAIEKFSENTERVKNPISYMLTILYKAQEQYDLDIANQVQYDMYNWEPPTEPVDPDEEPPKGFWTRYKKINMIW